MLPLPSLIQGDHWQPDKSTRASDHMTVYLMHQQAGERGRWREWKIINRQANKETMDGHEDDGDGDDGAVDVDDGRHLSTVCVRESERVKQER